MRCHWTHDHGRHRWFPLVADPEHDRVLHLFADAPVVCPGQETERAVACDTEGDRRG